MSDHITINGQDIPKTEFCFIQQSLGRTLLYKKVELGENDIIKHGKLYHGVVSPYDYNETREMLGKSKGGR